MRLLATDLACIRGGREVFAGLSFSISAGQALVVLGPNGVGKSSLLRLLTWREQNNVYAQNGRFFNLQAGTDRFIRPVRSLRETLSDWQQFWGGADAGSIQGRIQYDGGELAKRLANQPEKLAPADFRLGPNSAGKGAGENGKDLGADVDLVGPGAAYERWKQSPDYQQWLKETGQMM